MLYFGLLVDITGPLNEINCRLQGKGQLILILYDPIKGFQTKRSLCERQLKANHCSHFPALAEVNGSGAYNSEKYSNCVRTLTEEFNDRFSDFEVREILIKQFSSFSVEIDATQTNLQLEFADSRVTQRKSNSLIQHLLISIQSTFLPRKYPEIRKHSLSM
jgi:hypothetical protein